MLGEYEHLKTDDGCQRLVRHGHGPERQILTGIGPVAVRRPKVRDRDADGNNRIRFTSAILPRFARRTRSVEAVLPTLLLAWFVERRLPGRTAWQGGGRAVGPGDQPPESRMGD